MVTLADLNKTTEVQAEEEAQDLLGGIQYIGDRGAFVSDLGTREDVPLTLSGQEAFGALSARVEGTIDLDPDLTLDTRLGDVRGANGLGVRLGPVVINVDGIEATVDLTDAHRAQDVVDALEAAIQVTDATASVTIDPSGDGRGSPEPHRRRRQRGRVELLKWRRGWIHDPRRRGDDEQHAWRRRHQPARLPSVADRHAHGHGRTVLGPGCL